MLQKKIIQIVAFVVKDQGHADLYHGVWKDLVDDDEYDAEDLKILLI